MIRELNTIICLKEITKFFSQVNTMLVNCNIKKRKVTLQERLEDLLRIDYVLEVGYKLLQDFYMMMKFSSYDSIGQKLFEFCKRIDTDSFIQKEFKNISGILRIWRDKIRNSFVINPVTNKRLTNGFIEGKNNLV